jgi:hypothetical protein
MPRGRNRSPVPRHARALVYRLPLPRVRPRTGAAPLARWPIGYVITDYQVIHDIFDQEARLGMLCDDIVRL